MTTPPIMLAKCDGKTYAHILQTLIQNFNGSGYHWVHIKPSVGPKIICKNQTIRQKIMTLLRQAKVEYNTFASIEQKRKSGILRGICTGDNEDNITGISTTLNHIGIQNAIVTRFVTAYQKFNPNIEHSILYRITVPMDADETTLTQIRTIGNFGVRIEKMKASKVIQCRNSQRFGHTAGQCGYIYRCVQCTVSHQHSQCPQSTKPRLTRRVHKLRNQR